MLWWEGVVHGIVEGTPIPRFHLLSSPCIVDQPLRGLGTGSLGKTNNAQVHVYLTTNLVHTPPPPIATWCLFRI